MEMEFVKLTTSFENAFVGCVFVRNDDRCGGLYVKTGDTSYVNLGYSVMAYSDDPCGCLGKIVPVIIKAVKLATINRD